MILSPSAVGTRAAELLEMPVMLGMIVPSVFPGSSAGQRHSDEAVVRHVAMKPREKKTFIEKRDHSRIGTGSVESKVRRGVYSLFEHHEGDEDNPR